MSEHHQTPTAKKAHVIVIGNEKGGAGKTTTGMHLIVSLLDLGFSVGSIDVDSRQLSLTRYLENRGKTMREKGLNLRYPNHAVVKLSPFNIIEEAEDDEKNRFEQALKKALERDDFVIIDTPGSHSNLSRIAHSYADTIVTPINDSFVDLDVIVQVEKDSLNVSRPGVYSDMVWQQKINRAKRDSGEIDWLILRNRLASIDAKNKRNVAKVLDKLSQRIGLRQTTGFSERVIYREMFLHGLTLLDIMDKDAKVSLTLSHIAARQELRDFMHALNIPKLNARLDSSNNSEEAETSENKPEEVEENNTANSEVTIEQKEEMLELA